VFPLLAEALQGRQLSVGQPYFDRLVVPIGIALLFLMAVAPALPWRATSGEVLRHRLLVPAWAGVVTIVVAIAFGAHGLAGVATFGLGAFATAGIARQMWLGVRTRRKAHAENPFVATVRTVRGNPRLYGGLVVHLGVVLIAVAIALSSGYLTRREVTLARGESATVRGYKVTYVDGSIDSSAQKTTVKAQVKLQRGGTTLGTYAPAISTFPNANGGIGTPSVHTGLLRDVYLTLVSSPGDANQVTLGVAVNPMILWLWIGGAVMGLGTLLALVPTRRRGMLRDAETPAVEPAAMPALEEVPVG
jgi:cytochrome c-type biogenesis protein CcmF